MPMCRPVLLYFFGALLMSLSGGRADEPRLKYPDTKRIDLVEVLHGVGVADPYRWLEKDVRESSEVAAWVAEQQKVTDAFLEKIPQRDKIKQRMTQLWNYEKYSAPQK